ncbi:hypothetical protein GCM10010406_47720 [Streptomyces thermolineatus]|uniref:Uncharacterized protein n=1 Tax=Streptomyces thermolineatus TaxID=44033 RepID=A0ABN3MNU3_9ACTN
MSHGIHFPGRREGRSWEHVPDALQDTAAAVLGKVFALSAIASEGTGPTARAPRTELPVADMPPQHSTALMSQITGDPPSRYEA